MANNCKECNCNCHCSTKEHPNKTGVCSCTDCKCEQREGARNVILDKYYQYDKNIYENIHKLKDKLNNHEDLKTLSKEIKELDAEIKAEKESGDGEEDAFI